jgi:hypothetical protein
MQKWDNIIKIKKPLARQLAQAFRKAEIVAEGWYYLKPDGVHYEALPGVSPKAFDYAFPFIQSTLRRIYDTLRQHYTPPIIVFVMMKSNTILVSIDGIGFEFAYK